MMAAQTATGSPDKAEQRPQPPSESDTSDSESESPPQQVEWLATAREKRATAGNRMQSMLANEEPDSDLELLFAEDDDDQGFSDNDDDGSDVHMDSSSDDEDNNNAAGGDDLDGEKELERQAKEKRTAQRKRKAQDAHIPAKFRKKVRINTEAPPPRPKKKSERTSWLPTLADLPTRASSRSTTRLSKEQLHNQMVEREARRIKQVAQMAKKAAKLEAMRKPPMTQEERIQEAEKVEMRNRGSLNRWEEAERWREEERLRKLRALSERTLEGPVVTFWSGVREGDGMGGRKYIEVEEKPVKKKRETKPKGKKGEEGVVTPKVVEGEVVGDSVVVETGETSKTVAEGVAKDVEKKDVAIPADATQETPDIKMADAPPPTEEPVSTADAEGSSNETIKDEAVKTTPPATEAKGSDQVPKDTQATTVPASEAANQPAKTASPPEQSTTVSTPTLPPPEAHPGPETSTTESQSTQVPLATDEEKAATSKSKSQSQSEPQHPPEPPSKPTSASAEPSEASEPTSTKPASDLASSEKPLTNLDKEAKKETGNEPEKETKEGGEQQKEEGIKAPRNAIIFQNFNDFALRDKSVQSQILFGQKMAKLAKPPPSPLCVITNLPARYRDPVTGLPFATAHAYKELEKLRKGNYRWSKLLGVWVGNGEGDDAGQATPSAAGDTATAKATRGGGGMPARGVPARFADPNAPGPVRKPAVVVVEAATEIEEKGDVKGWKDGEKEIKVEEGTQKVPAVAA